MKIIYKLNCHLINIICMLVSKICFSYITTIYPLKKIALLFLNMALFLNFTNLPSTIEKTFIKIYIQYYYTTSIIITIT